MRISFDLDDTLICYGGDTACEPRLWWPWRLILRDEPLRAGTPRLTNILRDQGHDLWIYTTSHRNPRIVKWWLQLHGVRVNRVVNCIEHNKCFGEGSSPTKRPHAFDIDLHIDDSPGVAIEGESHGFRVCVVKTTATDWIEYILAVIKNIEEDNKH